MLRPTRELNGGQSNDDLSKKSIAATEKPISSDLYLELGAHPTRTAHSHHPQSSNLKRLASSPTPIQEKTSFTPPSFLPPTPRSKNRYQSTQTEMPPLPSKGTRVPIFPLPPGGPQNQLWGKSPDTTSHEVYRGNAPP
ncbi:MAG: hypothetical protein Q9218_007578 [Villophora microphyllina]